MPIYLAASVWFAQADALKVITARHEIKSIFYSIKVMCLHIMICYSVSFELSMQKKICMCLQVANQDIFLF